MTEKKEHPKAKLLRWIADGEEIQYYHHKKNSWENVSTSAVLASVCNFPSEVASTKYRIKPKTIRIGKYDVAEPMKEELADGCDYYFLDATEDSGIFQFTWDGGSADKNILANGLIWLSEDDALLAAKAIKELLTGQ